VGMTYSSERIFVEEWVIESLDWLDSAIDGL
jgi:hypothetical protein